MNDYEIDLEDIETLLYNQVYHSKIIETNTSSNAETEAENSPQNPSSINTTTNQSSTTETPSKIADNPENRPTTNLSKRRRRLKEKRKRKKLLKKLRNSGTSGDIEVISIPESEDDCVEVVGGNFSDVCIIESDNEGVEITNEPETTAYEINDESDEEHFEHNLSNPEICTTEPSSPKNGLVALESNSNDFISNLEFNQDRFNFSLHGSEFNEDFVRPATPVVDNYETTSSCSTSETHSNIVNPIVFNELDFPKDDIFSDSSLENFGNSIMPKKLGKRLPNLSVMEIPIVIPNISNVDNKKSKRKSDKIQKENDKENDVLKKKSKNNDGVTKSNKEITDNEENKIDKSVEEKRDFSGKILSKNHTTSNETNTVEERASNQSKNTRKSDNELTATKSGLELATASVGEIQDTMTDNPSSWYILDGDRWNTPIETKGGIRCKRCREHGHKAYKCPNKTGEVKCSLCGNAGHLEPRCPNKICTQCGRKSHFLTIYCKQCFYLRKAKCTICKMIGHDKDSCPDLWRRYHLTVKEGPLNEYKIKQTDKLWCSGCARPGHLVTSCLSFHPTYPLSDRNIHSYEDVYESLKQQAEHLSEQIKSRNDPQRNSGQSDTVNNKMPTFISFNSRRPVNCSDQYIESNVANPIHGTNMAKRLNVKNKFYVFNSQPVMGIQRFLASEMKFLRNLNHRKAMFTLRKRLNDQKDSDVSYKKCNILLFGIHQLLKGKEHMNRLLKFQKHNSNTKLDFKKRLALFRSYKYIFGCGKHDGIDYKKILNSL